MERLLLLFFVGLFLQGTLAQEDEYEVARRRRGLLGELGGILGEVLGGEDKDESSTNTVTTLNTVTPVHTIEPVSTLHTVVTPVQPVSTLQTITPIQSFHSVDTTGSVVSTVVPTGTVVGNVVSGKTDGYVQSNANAFTVSNGGYTQSNAFSNSGSNGVYGTTNSQANSFVSGTSTGGSTYAVSSANSGGYYTSQLYPGGVPNSNLLVTNGGLGNVQNSGGYVGVSPGYTTNVGNGYIHGGNYPGTVHTGTYPQTTVNVGTGTLSNQGGYTAPSTYIVGTSPTSTIQTTNIGTGGYNTAGYYPGSVGTYPSGGGVATSDGQLLTGQGTTHVVVDGTSGNVVTGNSHNGYVTEPGSVISIDHSGIDGQTITNNGYGYQGIPGGYTTTGSNGGHVVIVNHSGSNAQSNANSGYGYQGGTSSSSNSDSSSNVIIVKPGSKNDITSGYTYQGGVTGGNAVTGSKNDNLLIIHHGGSDLQTNTDNQYGYQTSTIKNANSGSSSHVVIVGNGGSNIHSDANSAGGSGNLLLIHRGESNVQSTTTPITVSNGGYHFQSGSGGDSGGVFVGGQGGSTTHTITISGNGGGYSTGVNSIGGLSSGKVLVLRQDASKTQTVSVP